MPAFESNSSDRRRLPPMIVFVASMVIVFHLSALVFRVLASPSGPWASVYGTTEVTPPAFAAKLDDITRRMYLAPLKMTHNYHFPTNQPEQSAVRFEMVLKDDKGDVMKTLRFPDPDANFWVRHRQKLLADGLYGDQPMPLQTGEVIDPKTNPDRDPPNIPIYYRDQEENNIVSKMVYANDLFTGTKLGQTAKPNSVFRLSDYSLVLARSYIRYAKRRYGAHTVEINRFTKEPIPPGLMLMPKLPEAFAETAATVEVKLGELTK